MNYNQPQEKMSQSRDSVNLYSMLSKLPIQMDLINDKAVTRQTYERFSLCRFNKRYAYGRYIHNDISTITKEIIPTSVPFLCRTRLELVTHEE